MNKMKIAKKKAMKKKTMADTKSKTPKPRASLAQQSRTRSEKGDADKRSLKKVLQQKTRFIKLDMEKEEDAKAAEQIIEKLQSGDAKQMREVIKEAAADKVNVTVLFGKQIEKVGPEGHLVIFP